MKTLTYENTRGNLKTVEIVEEGKKDFGVKTPTGVKYWRLSGTKLISINRHRVTVIGYTPSIQTA